MPQKITQEKILNYIKPLCISFCGKMTRCS